MVCHPCIDHEKALARIAELQAQLDLNRDEFLRIKALASADAIFGPEIVGLCDRSQQVIRQRVPLIRQLEEAKAHGLDACRELDEALAKIKALEDKFRPENFPLHQATECGKCRVRKHTPWIDDEYGYVCATCLTEICEARQIMNLGKLMNAIPTDVKRKVSLHDIKRICDNYNATPHPASVAKAGVRPKGRARKTHAGRAPAAGSLIP